MVWKGLSVLCALATITSALDLTRFDNNVVYWGQNSYGATHASDEANWQKTLSYYCQDDAIDVIPIAFIDTFFSTGNLPSLNLASTCNPTDNATFAGSTLPNCAALATDIEFCQSKGKTLLISLGGAGGGVGFTDDAQATTFAQTIWNIFLGGSSTTRPFGSAVLDGVDLDIESGTGTGYAAFVTEIRSLAAGASKPYYVTGAPQCVYPDAALGSVINAVGFDAIWVQFYNNPCGLPNYDVVSDWNFGIWDEWARTISPNSNTKVFIGAPASSTAAGTGYTAIDTLASIAKTTRDSFPSFGGIMLWDASQAYVNDRYDLAVKDFLVANGGTGFTYPSCSGAPAWASGSSYTADQQVSYGGYIWEAKWYADDTPTNDPNSDWSAISACSGSGGSGTTTSKTTTTTTSTTSKTTSTTSKTTTTTTSKTTSTTTSSPSGGSCAGVAAWSSSVAYTGGEEVTYGGYLWEASWWTEADTPGGSAGVWVQEGACTTAAIATAAAQPLKSAAAITSSAAKATVVPERRNSRIFRGL